MFDLATFVSIVGIVGTFVGIVGTLVSIWLVHGTLIEMRNQRISEHKPDLILPRFTIHGYAYGSAEKQLSIGRLWSSSRVAKSDHHTGLDDAEMKLYNVGFGVAKNIELKWIEDYDKTIQQINDYCHKNGLADELRLAEIEDDRDKNGSVTEFQLTDNNNNNDDNNPQRKLEILESGITATYDFPDPPDLPDSSAMVKFDYLLPVSITNEGRIIRTSRIFIEIISIVMYLETWSGKSNRGWNRFEVDPPSIKLEVSYDDIEGNRYQTDLDFEFVHDYHAKQKGNQKYIGIGELRRMWKGEIGFKPMSQPQGRQAKNTNRKPKLKLRFRET